RHVIDMPPHGMTWWTELMQMIFPVALEISGRGPRRRNSLIASSQLTKPVWFFAQARQLELNLAKPQPQRSFMIFATASIHPIVWLAILMVLPAAVFPRCAMSADKSLPNAC